MMIVNIYLYQSIRGPGKKKGAYTYVLETEIDGKTITLTDTNTLEPMSENKAELTVMLKALKRLRKDCDVNIIGVSIPVKTAYDTWLDKWIKAEWKNAKGKEIANIEEWQQLSEFKNKYCIKILEDADNTYSQWMQRETEKRGKTQ